MYDQIKVYPAVSTARNHCGIGFERVLLKNGFKSVLS